MDPFHNLIAEVDLWNHLTKPYRCNAIDAYGGTAPSEAQCQRTDHVKRSGTIGK